MPAPFFEDELTDDTLVRVEAMDFTWVLPWRTVREDVRSGFATFLEVVEP
jgi:hypothetical protein